MTYRQVITQLKRMASAKNVAGMKRFGINPEGTGPSFVGSPRNGTPSFFILSYSF